MEREAGQSAAIELLLWRRVSALPGLDPKERTGCPGTFSQSLDERDEPLCVSFECDSLSEELEEKKKEEKEAEFCTGFLGEIR